MASQKGRVVFQPSIFRCQISFREGISIFNSMEELVGKQQNVWLELGGVMSSVLLDDNDLQIHFFFFGAIFFDGLGFLPWDKHHHQKPTHFRENIFLDLFPSIETSSRKSKRWPATIHEALFFSLAKWSVRIFQTDFFRDPWKPGKRSGTWDFFGIPIVFLWKKRVQNLRKVWEMPYFSVWNWRPVVKH